MFCLPNKFALFTHHMQPLKCVKKNSYLDLWSNTLYMKMKSFTSICFTLHFNYICNGVYICDGECLDFFIYFQRCLVQMKNH